MTKIISIANQKGGVGKTTCTINLGLPLTVQGKKCLFIDLDPQNNLGKTLAPELVAKEDYATCKSNAYTLFENVVKAEPFEFADNAFIIGGDKRMGNVTQDHILNFADSLDSVLDRFDFIFIDCPPSANTLQHAALLISNQLLIITQPQKMSIGGVDELMKTARQIRRMNPSLEVAGIILNLCDSPASNDQKGKEADLRKEYGNLVLKNKLMRTIRVSEALNVGKALFQTNKKAAEQFGFNAVFEELHQLIK